MAAVLVRERVVGYEGLCLCARACVVCQSVSVSMSTFCVVSVWTYVYVHMVCTHVYLRVCVGERACVSVHVPVSVCDTEGASQRNRAREIQPSVVIGVTWHIRVCAVTHSCVTHQTELCTSSQSLYARMNEPRQTHDTYELVTAHTWHVCINHSTYMTRTNESRHTHIITHQIKLWWWMPFESICAIK